MKALSASVVAAIDDLEFAARLVVDTGASSMGPGLETVLAQILGQALGLPPSQFDVRHADTAAVESGVGTYGSRGTVTATQSGTCGRALSDG